MSGIGSSASLPEPVCAAFDLFKATGERGRLAHGYVVSAPRTAWGVALAELAGQWLYCEAEGPLRPCGQCRGCRLVQNRTHPDMAWVEPEMKSRVISIDQMRELNHVLRQTSFEGGWKVAVIQDAHRLNENSANAFLKTLEEPPSRCLLLLVTDSPQTLLPTIRSRCQLLPVGSAGVKEIDSPVERVMLDWLRRRTGQESPLEQSAWIGALLREVRDRAEHEEKERATDEVDKEVIEARAQARVVGARQEVLRTLYQWERDVLALAGGADPACLFYPEHQEQATQQAAAYGVSGALQRLRRVEDARRYLEGNVPESSVWEAVVPL
ncbi:MAG TPA: DNA polymerase III subunit [Kiritimatiellia bacterium]|nr:DNA polymerase III subunit [Kiritimatiellia bacterium]HMO97948.1 DNA polymerase III subunit [Kiritimatiellia bacterium]HMP95299.1 DNA polymerase III subunit [Kiritimatiellia bacterium]